MNFVDIGQRLNRSVEFIKRLLWRDSFDIKLTLIQVILWFKLIVFYTLFWNTEHVKLSDIIKKSLIVVNWKISADKVWLIFIL